MRRSWNKPFKKSTETCLVKLLGDDSGFWMNRHPLLHCDYLTEEVRNIFFLFLWDCLTDPRVFSTIPNPLILLEDLQCLPWIWLETYLSFAYSIHERSVSQEYTYVFFHPETASWKKGSFALFTCESMPTKNSFFSRRLLLFIFTIIFD